MNAPARIATPVRHVAKGRIIEGAELEFGPPDARFTTPKLDLDALVWPRYETPPAADIPVDEIIDVLVATGERLTRDPDGIIVEAMQRSCATSSYPRDLVERAFASLGLLFNRRSMEFELEQAFGGKDVVDGWREVTTPNGRKARIRAFPPRLVHVIAGNSPGVAAQTIVRGALVKGVHLLKLPSNELFSAPAILATMAAAAPGHPLNRCFSAAYWRGGDEKVESLLFRPQFFDKVIAWGGENTIRGVLKYVGPGLELVSFDPKTSISMIGREVFEATRASEAALEQVVEAAAHDATLMNQQACTSARFQFVEGEETEVDRFCALLQARLGRERRMASAQPQPIPSALRDEIEGLRDLPDFYRVWGGYEGRGLVIRSDEPVGFYPEGKVVNVVRVRRLEDAVKYVTVATSTVGVYPPARKEGLRMALASAGAQRVVTLGLAGPEIGLPHDGFYPLQRLVRWVNDEG
ncbi:MAG TPA: acyl-CoA reductase [Burkholderiaceae bacterium]|nr:acyl-CoA reductase [Burkholderiaceae bacterium]